MDDAVGTRTESLRIALIGPSRFGIGEPIAGGLEAHTATLARALLRRGHRVTVFAGHGESARPGDLQVVPILARKVRESLAGRDDTSMSPERWKAEYEGYCEVLRRIALGGDFDITHNNSLHYLPPAQAARLSTPTVHTLHCPPFPDLVRGHRAACGEGPPTLVAAVSRHLAGSWDGLADRIVPNGIDTDRWTLGPGGSYAVWSGRIVPEKAPHLAIEAAKKADVPLTLAGPIQDRHYFDSQVAPLLGSGARWVGHLGQTALERLYRNALVGVVTPEWDEPFGLVAPEMMACGTPVAGFARGGLGDILTPGSAVVAKDGDPADLAAAIGEASNLDRRACRDHVLTNFTDRLMARRYECIYRELLRW